MTLLVQLQRDQRRRLALVEEPSLRFLERFDSVYALAQAALAARRPLLAFVREHLARETLAYDPVYRGEGEWRLLPPIDFPGEPARCLVSGTGLTHLGSAKNRQAMHAASAAETDSMRMFRWGVEGGKPARGQIGTAPEWFYKGCGTILRAHGERLVVPPYAEDGGEEAEIAGVYLVDAEGNPRRLGMAIGNEFSDHRFEKKNYLNLAGSKVRNCSLGPELVLDPDFRSVRGQVTIERAGKPAWTKEILTGESEMCHSLQNIEHHHFKFESHRRPGDVHVHYFGACALSFGDGVQLAEGDVMKVDFPTFGRALCNPLSVAGAANSLITVSSFA